MNIENTQAESHAPKQEGDGSASGLTGSEASPRPINYVNLAIKYLRWERQTRTQAAIYVKAGETEKALELLESESSLTENLSEGVNAYDSLVGALAYLANKENWTEGEDGGYSLARPGGFRQEGIVLISGDIAPWIFASDALSQVPDSRGGK